MLSRLLSYRPLLLIASLATWTITFCLPLVTGLVNQRLFDGLQFGDTSTTRLVVLFAALVMICVATPVTMYVWFWVHTTFETTLEALVRTNLYAWMLEKVGRKRPQPSTAHLVGHLRDDVPGHTDIVNEWYRLSGEAIFVVVALVIMVGIDPLVTVVTFVPVAAVVLATHWMRARLPRLWAEAREATTAVTHLINDVFSGVQAIKGAGAEHAVAERMHALNDHRRRAEIRSSILNVRIDALTSAIVVSSRGMVLLVAAGAMVEGRFTIGDFLLFVTYLDWMLMLPRRIGRLLSQNKESGRALARLGETMGETPVNTLVRHRPVHLTGKGPEPERPTRSDDDRLDELTVHGLCYVHPESGQGIRDVDLRLLRGTVTVVTGGIGSGKSTLVEVLLGLKTADSGEIRWNGEQVTDPGTAMRPPRVAYKPQVPRLFSESLRDTVLLGEPAEGLEQAVHRAAFDRDVAALPGGLDTLVGSRGVRLSGGQLQRASAARMFVRSPELYVIDDLSSALDEETEQLLWERWDQSRADSTYLVVSHRPSALRRADTIVVLEEGRVTATGSLNELADGSPVIQGVLGRYGSSGGGGADRFGSSG